MPSLTTFLSCGVIFFQLGCATSTTQKKQIHRSSTDDFQIHLTEYSPAKDVLPLTRTVVIFPPTGGSTFLERSYAKSLAQRGAQVLLLESWTGMTESSLALKIHQTLQERAMKAFALSLEKTPEDHRVSVLGTSVGGIFSSNVAHRFDRVEKVVMIAAGAPIPDVIVHSDQSALERARENREKEFGFTSREEYAKALHQEFSLDPLNHPAPSGVEVGMFVLTEDDTVPTRFQQRLASHWNQPWVTEISSGHFWGIVRTWWSHSERIVDFLLGDKSI